MEAVGSSPLSQIPATFPYPEPVGPCRYNMARPQVADGRTACNMEGNCGIYWIISRGHPRSGGPPVWVLGEVLTTPHRKNLSCYGSFKKVSDVECINYQNCKFCYFSENKTCGYSVDSLSRSMNAPFGCEFELCILKWKIRFLDTVQVLTVTHKKLSRFSSGQALSAPEGCASRAGTNCDA
jgi:hypothetical protein